MSKYEKLLELKDYADAKPILEDVKNLSEASWTLAQTAYQIKETQPQIARNFLKTVIKECEDEDKKVEETDDNTDNQSSSTTGLEKVGSDKGDGDKPVTGAGDTKDQMGVAIGEMAPPMGMPPQVPPQAPPVPPQTGMPPPPPVPQQNMQYTIQEATAIRGQFKAIHEAIKALTQEVKETKNSQIKSIDVGTSYKGQSMAGRSIRETTGDKEQDLTKTRSDITKMNDEINKQR